MNKIRWETRFKDKFTNKAGNVVAEDQEEVLFFIRQELIQEYKDGFNACLREQGLIGAEHQYLYL